MYSTTGEMRLSSKKVTDIPQMSMLEEGELVTCGFTLVKTSDQCPPTGGEVGGSECSNKRSLSIKCLASTRSWKK